MEKKLEELSESDSQASHEDWPRVSGLKHQSAPHPATVEVGTAQLRARERAHTGRVQGNEDLDLDTRVKYLEEDLEDNRIFTNHKLQSLHDRLADLQRRESEMFQELHGELSEDVDVLEDEINSTFTRVENENDEVNGRVDVVSRETRNNMRLYYHANDGLHRAINYIRHVEFTLEDQIYYLEQNMTEVMGQLWELQRLHGRGGEGNKPTASEPSVEPVGKTQSRQRVVSDAEKSVVEWMKESEALRQSSPSSSTKSDETAKAESEVESAVEDASNPTPSILEALLHELYNYNM